jgi:hypothetical protein
MIRLLGNESKVYKKKTMMRSSERAQALCLFEDTSRAR